MRLRDSTVALPRRWDCVSTELQHQETHERGMIKDKSAVSDPERRYAFRQVVGRVNDPVHRWRPVPTPELADRFLEPPFGAALGVRGLRGT